MARQLRRKTSQEQEHEKICIDRISELPDSLISKILSLLDTKDAVKTCVLSTKWKYSWTHVDNFVFEFRCQSISYIHEGKKLNKFMSFVDKTLMQSTCSKIKTFSLTGGFYVYYMRNTRKLALRMEKLVDKWLEFVLGKNVQFIKLELPGLNNAIPNRLYHSSSLERLEISQVGKEYCGMEGYTALARMEFRNGLLRYKKTFDVCWNVLKSLYISTVYVEEEFMAEILLGSPMLETIVLEGVKGLSKLDITSPSVSELKLEYLMGGLRDETFHLDITAPWIKKLEVDGFFHSLDINLVNVTSLEKAKLTLSYEHYDPVDIHDEDYMLVSLIDKLLKPVSHVNELVIGSELLQALSISQLRNKPFMKFECKDLAIHSSLCVHDVPGIACLLESSPNLENLVVMMMPLCHTSSYGAHDYRYNKYIEKFFISFDGVDYLSRKKKKFPCLTNVKIDCREISYSCHEHRISNNMGYEFEIVAYIIKHAPSLEKLVILCSKSNCSMCQARYVSLLSSEDDVGNISVQWELKKTGCTYEYKFSR